MKTDPNPSAIAARVKRLADLIDVAPIVGATRRAARHMLLDVAQVQWPEGYEPEAAEALKVEIYSVGYGARLGEGPLRESARRIRALTAMVEPAPPQDIKADTAVLTPAEAAVYLGLDRLGVANPEARVRYLVKTKRLRSIRVLGRTAFLRSDLDEFLIRKTKARS